MWILCLKGVSTDILVECPSRLKLHLRSKGWNSGGSTRLPAMWPRFKSRHWCHNMWVEFVVGSLLCCERFFSGYSSFPLSSKTNFSKFQFDQDSGKRRTTLWVCYLQIIIIIKLLLLLLLLLLLSLSLQPKNLNLNKAVL